jgi:hypothetical protein
MARDENAFALMVGQGPLPAKKSLCRGRR